MADTVTLREHLEALRAADQHALQIKEEADQRALVLARQIQDYKDEKANELRAQIESERGSYATQTELKALTDRLETLIDNAIERFDDAHKPVVEFMASQTSRTATLSEQAAAVTRATNNRLIAVGVAISAIVVLVNVLFFVLAGQAGH
jgi:vacuolar-type H+-ATPase subunit E/Vma4